jgi:hypothetical protein
MWKTIFLAGVCSLLALTVHGAGANEGGFPLTRPDGPFKKSVTVEIQGKLRKVVRWIHNWPRAMMPLGGEHRFPMPTVDFVAMTHWEITAGETTYELELGTRELQALAEKLDGQTVLLEGRLEMRWREGRVPTGPCGIRPMIAPMPMPVAVVVVGRVQAVATEFLTETTSVVISGKLQMNARLGYPAFDSQAVITAGGKTYVVDFGGNAALRLAAQSLDGTTIAIKGTFTGFYSVHTMCVPTQSQLPIIRIDSVEPGRGESVHRTITVQIKGKLDIPSVWTGGREHQDEPEFRATVGGQTYGLDFADKQALRNLVAGLNGKTVILTGTLELRRTFAGTVWQVVVVGNLQADRGDFVRQTETIEFCCSLVPAEPAIGS